MAKENPSKLLESLRNLRGFPEIMQSIKDNVQKIFKFFGEIFKSKDSKSLWGACVGCLTAVAGLFKKKQPEQPASSAQEAGQQTATGQKEGVLPPIPPQLTETLNTISEPGKRIMAVLEQYKQADGKIGVIGDHCWDFATKILKLAGCERGKRIFFSADKYSGLDCGDHHAKQEDLNKIESGDHIFVNNKNTSDEHGNHSCIFLKWIDRANLIAEVAGASGGRPGSIGTSDFKKTPVTCIYKAVISKKN